MQTQLKLRDMWLKDVQESNRKYNVLQVIHDKAQNAPGDLQCISQRTRVGNLKRAQLKVQRAPGDSRRILLRFLKRI